MEIKAVNIIKDSSKLVLTTFIYILFEFSVKIVLE